METDLLFWMLIILISIELLAIYIVSNAIKAFLKSNSFKKKINQFHDKEKEKKKGNNIGTTLLVMGFFLQVSASSFATATVSPAVSETNTSISHQELTIYILVSVSIILLGVLLHLKKMMTNLININKAEEEIVTKDASVNNSKLVKILTDRVAEEDESSIDLGHDYDGIRELDNNLPPWWKWGFYLSIVIAIAYFAHYHVIKTGDLQMEEYKKEIAQAELDIAKYLEDQAMNVDENSVTIMVDQGDLSQGKSLFKNYCSACHQENGGGLIGPNLTDAYWLHGGSINDVFKTIKYGANNGMKSWKDELNPIQIQQVASFIKSLEGSNPADAKEPEGTKYTDAP